MKLLCFSGCSITWGDELHDRMNERFSALVSQHYDCKAFNLSERGISNDAIVRRTIKYLQSNKPDVLVMQFTVNQRIEYFGKQKIEHWTPQNIKSRRQRDYYTQTYNSILGNENLWKNIFLFDCFCKSVGQKYVSVIADHYEMTIYRPEKFYKQGKGYWRDMCECSPPLMHIDLLGDFFDFPEHYANGPKGGHPTAKAHQIIADKIIELIDAI